MKDTDQIKKDMASLYSSDAERLRSVTIQIEAIIKSNAINEDNLRNIINACNELLSFRESFELRLLNLLKQNHII